MWKKSETAMYGFLLAPLTGAAVAKTAKVAVRKGVKYIIDEQIQ
jgi:hypothetical protein